MNIIHQGVEISPSKEGVVYGGVENSVLRLAKKASERGYSSDIVTNDKRFREEGVITNGYSKEFADFYFTLVNGEYAGLRYSVEHLLKSIYMSRQVNKSGDPDLIHGHSGLLKLTAVTDISSAFTRLPAVHTVYCPPSQDPGQQVIRRVFSTHISEFVAISENVRSSLLDLSVDEHDITVIPPIIDYETYRPGVSDGRVRERHSLDDDDFAILYLGNLSETKCVTEIIDALGIVKEEGGDFTLLSGPELSETPSMELSAANETRKRDVVRRVQDRGIQEDIVNLGPIENVEHYLDEVDLVVAPFKHTRTVADYPLAIVEALATGTPVVASPVGGIPEIVDDGETGVLVDPEDATAIADAVLELMDDRERAHSLGHAGADHIRERIDNDRSLDDLSTVYERVVDQ